MNRFAGPNHQALSTLLRNSVRPPLSSLAPATAFALRCLCPAALRPTLPVGQPHCHPAALAEAAAFFLGVFGGTWSAIAASSMDRRHGDRRHGPASSLRPRRSIELVKLSSTLGIACVRQVNLHEAKTHLSRLVAQAVAGESFVICKAGVPLVQVTRLNDADIQAPPPRRRLGLLAGHCSVPDDFDRIASDEIADLFEGGPAQDPSASSPIEGDAR